MPLPPPPMDTPKPLTIAATGAPETKPNYQRPEYVRAQPARDLCHAMMRGTTGVRALGDVGLPKWPAEKTENYKIRAKITQVARYYQRTVQASVGMICATPPTINDDADPLLKSDAEDIDGRGTHFEVLAKHIADDAINGGFCGIFVDAPPIPAGLSLTLADEQALGLRPFWLVIPADRIVSWIVDVPQWPALLAAWASGALTSAQVRSYAKQTITRQVVLHEPTDVTAGAFGVTCKDRYRVLSLTDDGVTFAVWEYRKAEGTGEYFVRIDAGTMHAAGGQPFREIPLALVYAGRHSAPFVAEPPLLALAELNLDHYQVSADRRYLMRLCHAPTLVLSGFDAGTAEDGRPKPIEVGPNSVLSSPDTNAKASYVAADPNALDSSREEKEELVRQMATLGMSFIGKDKRGMAETATGRALDDAAENSSHATVARGLQDGLEQAWRFHAMYRGVKAPEVTVNTSYASAQVDPQLAAILWQAVAADKLPIEAFIAFVTTGALPDDVALQVDALRAMQAAMANADAVASADAQPTGKPSGPVDIEYDDAGRPTRLVPTQSAA